VYGDGQVLATEGDGLEAVVAAVLHQLLREDTADAVRLRKVHRIVTRACTTHTHAHTHTRTHARANHSETALRCDRPFQCTRYQRWRTEPVSSWGRARSIPGTGPPRWRCDS
jgi:hypothetical protein